MRIFYDSYSGKIMAICKRYETKNVLAEDVFQDAFIRIFDQLNKYDASKGDLGGWIYRVTVNVALKLIQKEKRLIYEDSEVEPEERCDLSILSDLGIEELYSLIEKLPEGQRFVFNLYIIEGHSHKEISELLNITESTSKSQLRRAKAQLAMMINRLKEKV